MARPKGSKNKVTIATEQAEKRIMAQVHGLMLRDIYKVLEAVQKKAIDGDMQAAKLILDRVVPARRSIDERQTGQMNIQINIVGDNHGVNQDESEPGERKSSAANGKVYEASLGCEEFPEHAGEEGP